MSLIYFNGQYVEDIAPLISHRDCGFTTAIGIFDSMAAKDGEFVHAEDHFNRILHDSKIVIGLTPDLTLNQFQKICIALMQKNNASNGYARIRTTVTGGEVSAPLAPAKKLTVLIDVANCPAPPETPITCAVITDYPRIAGCLLENCKRLDYARSYAARRAAKQRGAEEAILTNTKGNIICGATSNIFIEENETLITPPLNDGVLAGVTRKNIVLERHVIEETISPERLHAANKIFLTNSFIGLRRVILK